MCAVLTFSDFEKYGEDLESIRNQLGGKGLNLFLLHKFKELSVPEAFFVTTDTLKEIISQNSSKILNEIRGILQKLINSDSTAGARFTEDLTTIAEVASSVRDLINSAPLPEQIQLDVKKKWEEFCALSAPKPLSLAVRSSGLAEDTAAFSFAGQHDTYLNINSYPALLQAISNCFASLFTDRALGYRMRNGFMDSFLQASTKPQESGDLSWIPLLCVVCQVMVDSQKSGVMFTANPVNSHRQIISIDCSFGLGEAIVSGIVNPDCYKVRKENYSIVEKRIGKKESKIVSKSDPTQCGESTAFVQEIQISDEKEKLQQALSDEEIVKLAKIGVFIENEVYGGVPQDVEYGFDEKGDVHILQSRAITTLFPIPESLPNDILQSIKNFEEDPNHQKQRLSKELRFFMSFGHNQSMTQGMKLFGLSALDKSLYDLTGHMGGPFGTTGAFLNAGGHGFIDFTDMLGINPVKIGKGLSMNSGLMGKSFEKSVSDPFNLPRIEKKSIFNMWAIGKFYKGFIFKWESWANFFDENIDQKLKGYYATFNAKTDEMIEKYYRKPFEPIGDEKESENFMEPHLKDRLSKIFNGDLHEKAFGNILEKEKILHKRMKTFESEQEEAKFMVDVARNLVEQTKKIMGAISEMIGPMGSSMLYTALLEKIFDYNYKTKEGQKPTKELAEEILSGLHNNVTTEMDFMVYDISEKLKSCPKIVEFLRKAVKEAKWNVEEDEFVIKPKEIIFQLMNQPELVNNGGKEVADELKLLLYAFGFRGPSEIDVSRMKYSENVYFLIQTITCGISEITNEEKQENKREKFKKLQKECDEAGQELLCRQKTVSILWNALSLGLGSSLSKKIAKCAVKSVRYGLGLREAPKHFWMKLLWEIKIQTLLMAAFLKKHAILEKKKDILHFTLDEISQIMRLTLERMSKTSKNDEILAKKIKELVQNRKKIYKKFKNVYPSSVVTSDGEEVDSSVYNDAENVEKSAENPNMLMGQAVSKGKYEGFARVVLSPQDANIKKGEILICRFTDPGWTPLFTMASAVVLEVGGYLTHGSVTAREMGLPAVVGVSNATKLIKTGDLICVDCSRNCVEIKENQSIGN